MEHNFYSNAFVCEDFDYVICKNAYFFFFIQVFTLLNGADSSSRFFKKIIWNPLPNISTQNHTHFNLVSSCLQMVTNLNTLDTHFIAYVISIPHGCCLIIIHSFGFLKQNAILYPCCLEKFSKQMILNLFYIFYYFENNH